MYVLLVAQGAVSLGMAPSASILTVIVDHRCVLGQEFGGVRHLVSMAIDAEGIRMALHTLRVR